MRKNILSGFLCLTLVFASCGQSMEERGESSGTLGESVPLNVEVSLSAEGVQSPSTRAAITEDKAEIGVFLTNQNGYTPQYNRKYIYGTTTKWRPKETPITVKTKAAKVVAYYAPKGLEVTFGESSTVTTSTLKAQSYDASQLWYYDNTHTKVTSTNPAITFNMKPAYARLSFKISRNSSYPGAGTVSDLAITCTDGVYYTTTAVNIADGSSTSLSKSAISIYTKDPPFNIPANTPDTSVDLLIPPQPPFGLMMALTVDGKPLSVTIPSGSFNEDFAPGSHYTVSVQISSAGVSGVIIPSDWIKGDEINGSPTAPAPPSVP